MKYIKKVTAAAVVLALIFCAASCALLTGKNTESGDTAADSTGTEESGNTGGRDYTIVENDFYDEVRRHLNSIRTNDYEGAVFLIATPAASLFNEDECGTVMGRAVADRNSMVEEKLNVSVVAKYYDPDSLYSLAYNSNLAGDYFADLIMMPQYYIGQYASSGMLLNLNSLPFADYSAGYNIETGVSAAMGGANGYALAGWASLDCDMLPCVFFNRGAAQESGLESPYELVRRGEWTWDKFFEYTAAVTDINGKLGGNMYSWGTQNLSLNMADIVYASEGNRFISGGPGNGVYVSLTYDGSLHAVENGQRLYNEALKNPDSMSASDVFSAGGSLFLIDRMGTMKSIAASPAEWGILPMPKATAEQESYYSLAPSDSLFFGVLSSSKNAEEISLVLASLNAASLGYMTDAYVSNSMYYYLRDNDSAEMAEKVCYGVTYDMAYSFGYSDSSISNATYFALRNVYEMNHDLNFYLNRFENGANRALSGFFPQ